MFILQYSSAFWNGDVNIYRIFHTSVFLIFRTLSEKRKAYVFLKLGFNATSLVRMEDERNAKFWQGNLKERRRLEYLDIDSRTIVK
jgi:hypothetical protein